MKRKPKIEMPSIDPTLLPKSEKMNQEEENTQQEPRAGPSKEPEKRTKPVGVTKKDPLAIEMEAEHLQLVESTAVTFNPGKPKAKGSRTGKEAQQKPMEGSSKESKNSKVKQVRKHKIDPVKIEMEAECHQPDEPKAKRSRKQGPKDPLAISSKEPTVKKARKRKADPPEANCMKIVKNPAALVGPKGKRSRKQAPDETKTKRSRKQGPKDPLAISSKELTAKKARKRKADPPEGNCMQIVKNPAALVGPKGKRSRKQAPIEPVAGPSKSRNNQSTNKISQTQLAMNTAAVPGFPKAKKGRPRSSPAPGSSKTTKKRTRQLRTSFDCNYCSVTYSTKRRLLRHWSTHYNEKIFLCSICGGRFTHGDGLRKHNVKLHKINFVSDLECVFCPESRTPHTFRTEMDLMRHCQVEHINKISTDRRLKMDKSVRVYLEKQDRENVVTCDLCPKSFTRGQNLFRHKSTHFDRPLLECTSCDAAASNFTSFYTHMTKEHAGAKLFARCAYCHVTFPTTGKLLEHAILAHASFLVQKQPVSKKPTQKPLRPLYQCLLCSKTTRDRRDLHRHEVTHIRLHLYACPFKSCQLGPFSQANFMRKHLAAEHPRFSTNNFRCGVCLRFFPTERFLLNHALNEHMPQQQPMQNPLEVLNPLAAVPFGVHPPLPVIPRQHPVQQPEQKLVELINPLAVVPFGVHLSSPVVSRQYPDQKSVELINSMAVAPFDAHQPPSPAIVPPKKRRPMINSETSVKFGLYLDTEHGDPTREMGCVVCKERFEMSNYPSHVMVHHKTMIGICACALCKERFGGKVSEMYKHRKDVHFKQGLAVRVTLYTPKLNSDL